MSIQLPDRPPATEVDDVRLLGFGVSLPADSSLRLDQPCTREHGSLGGWRQDDAGEIAYTLLWRPLGYWSRDDVPAEDLQSGFVGQALASTRKDSRLMTVEDRCATRIAGHAGELVDTTIHVRRRIGRVVLRRRQALWTCRATGRHVALEVSALADAADLVEPVFRLLTTTVSCHETARS